MLDCSVQEKPVMNVDDIYLALHYHWVQDVTIYPDGRQRLQVSFLMLISAYTATRPGALVYVARNVKEYKSCPGWDEDDNEDRDEENSENDEIDDNEDRDKGDVENDKMDDNEDGNKDSAENDEMDDTEDSDKDNVKNDEMDDKIVKAFLGHPDGIEPVKTLCYEDVNLLLLPNPAGPRDLLALEIDLRYTKGHQRQTKRSAIYSSFFATVC
jgi:hypothetical protein